MQPRLWQLSIVLIIGILSVSAAAIFIRLAMDTADNYTIGFSLFLAAFRLIISALILLPTWRGNTVRLKNLSVETSKLASGVGERRDNRAYPNSESVTWGKIKQLIASNQTYYFAIAAGFCLGFHFATWISSLAFTSVAASTTLVTTNPIWVALLSRWWFKERLSQKTTLGIGVAVVGSVLIALGDNNSLSSNHNSLLGAILALTGAMMASLYIICGRQAQHKGLSLTNYIAIAYTTSALILFPLPLLFGASYQGYPKAVYVYGLLMAILSQIVGHTSLNWALRWLSPTIVTLCILVEPVGSSSLAWIFLGEIPSTRVILGGFILLLGVAIAVINQKSKEL